MCDTVARSLYAAGYEVDTCYDGAEALECILAENYDLIVLDLNLPGMDGMDLLKELRKNADWPVKPQKQTRLLPPCRRFISNVLRLPLSLKNLSMPSGRSFRLMYRN